MPNAASGLNINFNEQVPETLGDRAGRPVGDVFPQQREGESSASGVQAAGGAGDGCRSRCSRILILGRFDGHALECVERFERGAPSEGKRKFCCNLPTAFGSTANGDEPDTKSKLGVGQFVFYNNVAFKI